MNKLHEIYTPIKSHTIIPKTFSNISKTQKLPPRKRHSRTTKIKKYYKKLSNKEISLNMPPSHPFSFQK